MKASSLIIYLILLAILCTAFIVGMQLLGEQGAYLAQGYMLTPAIAALITRFFFYEHGFKDANLRFGRLQDYVTYWLFSLGITLLSYLLFTLLGAISWDFTGNVFLERLTEQFAAAGQDINDTLPPGLTPKMMLWLFFIGGLTVFNLLPGIITGFGEEFGHRGFMFPALYRLNPWLGLIGGGLIWYGWHLPLAIVIPQTVQYPLWQTILNVIILAVGSICGFTYLAYVYVKSRTIWVTAIAHIVMNNSAAAFSYFVVIHNQVLANLGLTITMILVVLMLYNRQAVRVFKAYRDELIQDRHGLPPSQGG